jgi:hypothetical protein
MAYRQVRGVIRSAFDSKLELVTRDGQAERFAYEEEVCAAVVRAVRTSRLQLVTIDSGVVVALLDA